MGVPRRFPPLPPSTHGACNGAARGISSSVLSALPPGTLVSRAPCGFIRAATFGRVTPPRSSSLERQRAVGGISSRQGMAALVCIGRDALTPGSRRVIPHMLRYTSSSTAWEAPLDEKDGPYLVVCPPHGVLPMGNIVTMISFRMLWGFSLKGLTTDAALR